MSDKTTPILAQDGWVKRTKLVSLCAALFETTPYRGITLSRAFGYLSKREWSLCQMALDLAKGDASLADKLLPPMLRGSRAELN